MNKARTHLIKAKVFGGRKDFANAMMHALIAFNIASYSTIGEKETKNVIQLVEQKIEHKNER